MTDLNERDSLSWQRAGLAVGHTLDGEDTLRKDFAGEIKQAGVDTDTRTVEAVISTGGIDRQGDTVDPNGWQLDRYMKNPVVLWAHDYKALPIAKALDVKVTGKGPTRRLKATARFETFPFADAVFNLIASGTINATSVGFVPLEYKFADEDDPERGFFDLDITKQELLEYSVVPVPANAEALIGAKSLTQEGRMALYDWVSEAVEEGHDTTFRKSDLDRLHQAWAKQATYTLPGVEAIDLAQKNIARMKSEEGLTVINNVSGSLMKVEGNTVTLSPMDLEEELVEAPTKPRRDNARRLRHLGLTTPTNL